MGDASFLIGRVTDSLGNYQEFRLMVNAEGIGRISTMGKPALLLDAPHWEEYKRVIADCDATIERLKKSGQLKYVAEGFQLAGSDS